MISNELRTQSRGAEDGRAYQKTSSTKHFSSLSQYDGMNFNSSLLGPSGSPGQFLKHTDSHHQSSIATNQPLIIDSHSRLSLEESDITPTIASIRRFQSPQASHAKIFSGTETITMVGKAARMRNLNNNLQVLNADSKASIAGSSPKSNQFGY